MLWNTKNYCDFLYLTFFNNKFLVNLALQMLITVIKPKF